MTNTRMLAAALACVALAAAWLARADGRAERKSPERAADVLSAEGMKLLAKPAKIEFFRIKPETSDDAKDAVERYPVIATGQTPDGAAKRLRKILASDDSYLFGTGKGCLLRPGVAIRVTGEDESVLNVVLCYECQILIARVRDAGGDQLHDSGGVFDPAEAALVELAKEAFPDDEAIQALKDEGN